MKFRNISILIVDRISFLTKFTEIENDFNHLSFTHMLRLIVLCSSFTLSIMIKQSINHPLMPSGNKKVTHTLSMCLSMCDLFVTTRH